MEMSRDDYIIKYADLSDEELLDELVKWGGHHSNISPIFLAECSVRTSALREVILDRMHS